MSAWLRFLRQPLTSRSFDNACRPVAWDGIALLMVVGAIGIITTAPLAGSEAYLALACALGLCLQCGIMGQLQRILNELKRNERRAQNAE